MKRFTLILSCLIAVNTWAADLTSEMDALGANKDLMKKAKAIDPKNRVRVVQNRAVDRTLRLEVGLNYGMNAGGDSYVSTNALGGHLDFHITPRWSFGARYYNYSNALTDEGERAYKAAANDPNARFPDVDYAKDSWLVIGSWYPLYGKMNMFDVSVAQFDIYILGGAGQINLQSGPAPTYTAGGGVGLWLAQHVSTRLEARWQGYQDKVYDGSRDINATVLSATIGLML